MPTIELIAAALGLVNVALVVRRSLWNYPFGLAMVSLYAIIFYDARLYSDALLQIFFFAIQIYGWFEWRAGRTADKGIIVEVMPAATRLHWLLVTALGVIAWGLAMDRLTDAAAPFADAAVAGMSVSAQLLQSRRRLECWVLWIVVDIVAVGLFWSRGLSATAILYAIFLGMAVAGGLSWWRQMRLQSGAVTSNSIVAGA